MPVRTPAACARYEHVVDHPAQLVLRGTAERVREVVRPDEDHVEVLDREDRVELLDRLGRLDLHRHERVLERLLHAGDPIEPVQRRAAGPCAADALRRVQGGSHRGRRLLGGVHARDDHAGRAGVQGVLDRGRAVVAQAHERGHSAEVGAGDDRLHVRRAEREVLGVGDEHVEARRGEHLARRDLRVRHEAADQRLPAPHPFGDPPAHARPLAQLVRGSSSDAAARASPNFSTIR